MEQTENKKRMTAARVSLDVADGFFMSLADSVPGVSGGTVAFILGFYEELLASFQGVFSKVRQERRQALLYLLRIGAGWVVGMGLCMVLLNRVFETHVYFLSSVFMGLTVASIPVVIHEESSTLKEKKGACVFILIGAVFVVGICLLRGNVALDASIDLAALTLPTAAYLIFAGAVGISAMALPGISGSSLLMILGAYLPMLEAVSGLVTLHAEYIPGLLLLVLGAAAGITLTVRIIRSCLRLHRAQTVFLIIGLLIGSLYAIAIGPTTMSPPLPAMSIKTFSVLGFLIGAALIAGLELFKRRSTQSNAS